MMVSNQSKRGDNLSITVFNNMGITICVDISLDTSVAELKKVIFSAFGELCANNFETCNLLHIRKGIFLKDEKSVNESSLRNADEILLVNKRKDVSSNKFQEKKKNVPGPSKEDIHEATNTIPVVNPEHSGEQKIHIDSKEHKGLFIIMIDLADRLLCLNEDVMKIYKEAESCFKEHIQVKEEASKYDQKSLVQLIEMGFSEKRAMQALDKNDNDVTKANQWLLENEQQESVEPKDNKNLPTEKGNCNGSNAGSLDRSTSNSGNEVKIFEMSRIKGLEKIKRMVRAFRAANSKGFNPNKKALLRLTDMGFEEDDAVEALRLHDNNEQEACNYLLSADSMKLSELDISEEEWTENSDLYDKLRDSYQIQSALNKPKSLIALLHILENSSEVAQWNVDADIRSLLQSMLKIYQKYKYDKQAAK